MQLGHGPSAFNNPNYRKLLAQSIQWAAGARRETEANARPATARGIQVSAIPGPESPAINGYPRTFLLEPVHLHDVRQRIAAGDKTLAPALNALEREAKGELKAGPFSVMTKEKMPPSGDKHDFMSQAPYFWADPKSSNGLPYIRRDGERNPEIYKLTDRRNLGRLIGAVETLSLAWYFTTNHAYAESAASLLRIWFLDPATRMNPNFEFAQAVPGVNTGRGTGLIETAGLTSLVDSIGLLAGSKAWTQVDQDGMQEWFSRFLKWMQESKNGRAEAAAKNNHGSWYDVQVASFSMFVGKTDEAREVIEAAKKKRIAFQIKPDGRQPLELERTKAWGYSIFNLRALMSLATVGERVGIDLWHFETSDGRSIRKALDYLIPFALKQKNWPYQQLDGFSGNDLASSLRLAARKYPEANYRAPLSKFKASNPADRSNLLRPVVQE
jgi:hypothetical protein